MELQSVATWKQHPYTTNKEVPLMPLIIEKRRVTTCISQARFHQGFCWLKDTHTHSHNFLMFQKREEGTQRKLNSFDSAKQHEQININNFLSYSFGLCIGLEKKERITLPALPLRRVNVASTTKLNLQSNLERRKQHGRRCTIFLFLCLCTSFLGPRHPAPKLLRALSLFLLLEGTQEDMCCP